MIVQYVPADEAKAIELVEVPDDPALQLQTLQRLIGGYVEQINTSRLSFQQNVLLVDEDARSKSRERNLRAQQLSAYPVWIRGNAIIAGVNDSQTKWVDYHQA